MPNPLPEQPVKSQVKIQPSLGATNQPLLSPDPAMDQGTPDQEAGYRNMARAALAAKIYTDHVPLEMQSNEHFQSFLKQYGLDKSGVGVEKLGQNYQPNQGTKPEEDEIVNGMDKMKGPQESGQAPDKWAAEGQRLIREHDLMMEKQDQELKDLVSNQKNVSDIVGKHVKEIDAFYKKMDNHISKIHEPVTKEP